MKFLTLSFLVLGAASSTSLASNSCLVYDSLVRSSKIVRAGQCQLSKSLELVRTGRDGYWIGEYQKEHLVRLVHEDIVSNRCTKAVESRLQRIEYQPIYITFAVDNPNLSQDVQHSWELAPMTDFEAQAAMDKVKRKCETSKP